MPPCIPLVLHILHNITLRKLRILGSKRQLRTYMLPIYLAGNLRTSQCHFLGPQTLNLTSSDPNKFKKFLTMSKFDKAVITFFTSSYYVVVDSSSSNVSENRD
jgi:hypothetical protein